MMAASGVKSNMPTLGMMRRRGASIGSVILSRIMVSVFGLVTNQDRITRMKMAKVRTSHRSRIKLNKKVTATYLPSSLALLYAAVTAFLTSLLNSPFSNWSRASAVVPPGEVTILLSSAGGLPDFWIR